MIRKYIKYITLLIIAISCFAGRAWFTFPRDNMLLSSHLITPTVEGMSVDSIAIIINQDEEKAQVKAMRPDGVAEFIGVELPRGNIPIKLYAFTNNRWRIQDSIMVTVPGYVHDISLEITPENLIADDKMIGRVNVALYDKWGNQTTDRYPVSLFIQGGKFVGDDVAPASEGFQVYSQNGLATAQFKVGNQAGIMVISALIGSIKETVQLELSTYMRPMIAVGQVGGELTVTDYVDISDEIRDDRLPGEEFEWDGRGAFFLKGAIRDKFLLSMSYDSKVTRRPMVYRRTDPDELMPIYGDTGSLFYENHATTPLFIRMERDKSYVQWSDYNTKLDDNTVFMKYTRTLTGVNGELYTKYFDTKLFFSPTIENAITQMRVHVQDTITPDGTSGFFYLSNGGIIRNSEQIRIETHDRYEPEEILQTDYLMRFEDYDIDYETGEVLFAEAILSHDGFRNPRLIVVEYEMSEGHSNAIIGGARLALHPVENVEFGFTGIIEDYEGLDHNIAGGDMTLEFLQGKFKLRGEVAYSFYNDSLTAIEQRDGLAYIAEGTIDTKKLQSKLYYRTQEEFYRNMGIRTTSRSGITKMGGNVNYDLQGYEFKIEGFNEFNEEDVTRLRGSFDLRKDFDRLTPSIGAEYNRFEDEDTLITNILLQGKLKWQLTTKYSMYVYHRQNLDLQNEYPNESALGAEYHLNGGHTIFGSYGFMDYKMNELDRQFANFGIRSTLGGVKSRGMLQATSQQNDPFNSQAIVNVSDRFVITEWLALDIGFENEKAVTGDNSNDHSSISGSVTLKPDGLLITQKTEYSEHESKGKSMLTVLAASTSNGRTFSMLAKGQFSVKSDLDDKLSNFMIKKNEFLLGFAIRPIGTDWINLLTKIEYEMNHNEIEYPYLYDDRLIFSIQDVIAIGNHVEFITRYAGKYNMQKLKMNYDGEVYELGGNNSYTDLLMGALRVDIAKRVDVGLEGRVLYQHQGEDLTWDIAPGIGVVPFTNVRLGFGWNVFGYTDEEFSSDSYYAKGPYFTIDLKLNERGIRLPVIDDPTLEDYHRRYNDSLYYPQKDASDMRINELPDSVYQNNEYNTRFGYTGKPDESSENLGEQESGNTEPSFVDPGYLRREDVEPPGP